MSGVESKQYRQQRECYCGHQEERFLDEIAAGFEEYREWTEPCSHCGSTQFRSGSAEMPILTRQHIQIWVHDENLHFGIQDQDLCLDQPQHLPIILEFLTHPETPLLKKRILASALYVLWYEQHHHAVRYGDRTIAEFADRVTVIIHEYASLLLELGAERCDDYGDCLWYVREYIKKELEEYWIERGQNSIQ